MPEVPAEAVQAAAEALRTKQWGSRAWSAHGSHKFHYDCEICQGNLPAMAEVALEAAAPFLAGVGSPVSCPSAAPESTHSPEAPSVAPVYRSRVERPAETLSALRKTCRICGHLTDSGKVCGPCRATPGVLDAAVERAEQAEATLLELAPLRDRTDAEDRLRRERNEWREQCEQAEAAIARVKGLHSEIPYRPGFCYCANPYPCPTIRALDGAGAVPEHTGHACGNCEGIDPASCINAPRPPASTTEETTHG